jgi:hypothetical protein
MTKFLFSDITNQTASAFAGRKKDNANAKKNEFNFTNYINQLKETSKIYGENYVKNLHKKQNEILIKDQYREHNTNQNYNNSGYYDSRNQDRHYSGYNNNSNNKKKVDKWGKQSNQDEKYSNYNNTNSNNNDVYNSNYNYAQGAPPQKPNSNNQNEILDYFVKQETFNNTNTNNNSNNNNEIQVDYSYEGGNRSTGGRGKRGKRGRGGNDAAAPSSNYGNFYENPKNEEINTVGLPSQKNKKGGKNYKGKYDTKQEPEAYAYNQVSNKNQDQTQFNESNANHNSYNNRVNNIYDNNQFNGPPSSSAIMLTMDPDIDYKFVLKTWVLGIREFLKEKIQKETLSENVFFLPAETIYQMIVIIDRLEKQKILELQSVINFGFDLEIVKEVRVLLISGFYDKESIYNVLDRLDIKKILLLYKYLHIASNKLNGLYYKLGK